MATLYIDSSVTYKTIVSLSVTGKRYELTSVMNASKSQAILPLVERLLKQAGLQMADITDVFVHTGPGSYTGLRVGIAIANMMGELLGVPVNRHPVGVCVEPIYDTVH